MRSSAASSPGIGFEIAKRALRRLPQHVPTYALIYGAFATIPIFLIWLYVSWLVVVTGRHLHRDAARVPREARTPSVPGEDPADALGVLGALANAHREGRVIALNTLARQQRILPDRCEQILERAAALGWAARTERDGWVLARDPSTIHIAEVYRAFVFEADAVGVPETDLGLSLRDSTAPSGTTARSTRRR